MDITVETVDQFKDKVEELVRKYPSPNVGVEYDKILKELFEYAYFQSRNYIPEHNELKLSHKGTGMDNSQFDYNAVFLSAVLISWAVRMQGVKAGEGQCWAHKNCHDARYMHSKIYDEWIEII